MTRSEFIAETAERLLASEEVSSVDSAIKFSVTLANSLESAGVAPWLTPPAPALTDAARRVVEAAVEWGDGMSKAIALHPVMLNMDEQKLIDAVRAYKESAK